MRRHPSTAKEEGDVKKSEDPNGFNAANAADGRWHEKGSFHHCHRMFWCGSLDGSLLMEQVMHMHASGHIISPEFHSQKNCWRRPMYLLEFVHKGIKDIPLRKQWTQRKLVMSLGVSKTMVHRWIIDSTIQVHSNSLKPVLMEENNVAWLLMALDSWEPQDPIKFLDMMDCIHMDEKWFFLSQQKERYLLLPEEKNPKRCMKSKSHTTKAMFLCAIPHPRFNPCANSWWDGKLGIWPIGDWEPAKRASKN